MTNLPLISVVIPVLNGERYIEKCLSSMSKQNIKDIEIIVVDNGSTDKTLAIAQKLAKEDSRIKIMTEMKIGHGPARRKGILNCRGQFIATTDIDCQVPPDWLEKITQPLIDGERAIMGGYYDAGNSFWGKQMADLENRLIETSTSNGYINYLDTKNCAFKKQTIVATSKKPLPPIADDLETYLRLNEVGVKIKYCPEAIVGHNNPKTLKSFIFKQYKRSFWTEQIYKKRKGEKLPAPQFVGRRPFKIILWPIWLIINIFKHSPAQGFFLIISEISWKAGWFVSLWTKKEW